MLLLPSSGVVGLNGEISKEFSKLRPLSGLKIIPARPSLVSSMSLQKIACRPLFQKLSCSSLRFCLIVRFRSFQEFGAKDIAFPVDGLCFIAPRLSNFGAIIWVELNVLRSTKKSAHARTFYFFLFLRVTFKFIT